MMTPAQLQKYEFKMAGRNAYKADDVDSFFAEVLINYEKIYRENGELIKRMSLLADRLQKIKNDETDISQAVMSAQKAADVITKEAESEAFRIKEEAENVLAAAKGEAAIIKSDAEKQAIADSELLLSMARDKAEDIMKKAKEKAHGILIAANDSASNTVGAANRTITSESIHYDMLKKEVSEFRASILAQYKAHIELISKLPELAIEEASKIEIATPPVADVSVENLENKLDEEASAEPEDSIIEFSDNDDIVPEEIVDDNVDNDMADDTEEVVEETYVDEEESFEVDAETTFDDPSVNVDDEAQSIPVSKKFTINTDNLTFEGFDDEDDVTEENVAEEISENENAYADSDDTDDSDVISASDDALDEIPGFEAVETVIPDEIEEEDTDGPDVILNFDSSAEDNDNEEDSVELTLDDFSDSASTETENVAVNDEKHFEDVYSNTDTEQFDDLIISFDDDDDATPSTDTNDDLKPAYDSYSNAEESAQSRRSRYAKMFGDDDDEEDDANDSISSFFGSIETISVDEPNNDVVEKKRKTGFFRRKK